MIDGPMKRKVAERCGVFESDIQRYLDDGAAQDDFFLSAFVELGATPAGKELSKGKRPSLSPAQEEALSAALADGYVVIGKGFGRGAHDMKPRRIAASTYVKLVARKLLTPNSEGREFRGEAVRVESGKAGYLTPRGRVRATDIYLREAAKKAAEKGTAT